MFKYPLFIVILIITIFFSCSSGGKSDESETADSCYTIKYINHISLTQPRQALKLLDTAEKKKKLSQTDVNGIRALIYYNGLNMTDMAIIYSYKAYENAKQNKDSLLMLKSLKQLAALYFTESRYAEAIKSATEGLSIAKSFEDKETAAYLLQFMGLSMCESESIDAGFDMLDRSNAIYKEISGNTDEWKNLDNYIYGLSQKANILIEKKQYAEALNILPQIESLLPSLANMPNVADGVLDMRKAEVYALFVMAYWGTNRSAKAHEYAKKCDNTDWCKTADGGQLLLPYFIETKQYDEALKRIKEKKDLLAAGSDTLTHYYVNNLLTCEVTCYEGKGNISKALDISKQIKAMTDSLYLRDKKTKVAELSTLYKTKDMEIQLLIQEQKMSRHNTIFIAVTIMLVILVGFIAVLLYYNRKISRKNKIAAAMISELIEAHDEQRMQKIAEPEPQNIDNEEDNEKVIFDRLDRMIVSKLLFLQPGFNRDTAASLVNISPKHLSALFQRFAKGFPDYINTLRLEYSVCILKSKPNYTIEGISQESGFSSRQTFHRLFVEKYGMTPTEFRSCPGNEK